MPPAILEACKGCIHECKISGLDGAKLVCCPQYKKARLGAATAPLKRRKSEELATAELSGKAPVTI